MICLKTTTLDPLFGLVQVQGHYIVHLACALMTIIIAQP